MKSKEQNQHDLQQAAGSPVQAATLDETKPPPSAAGADSGRPLVVLKTPWLRSGSRAHPATEREGLPVHVAPNLLGLVTGIPLTATETQAVKEQRQLNEVIHRMLVIGLAVSTILMLTGLGLDLLLKRDVPTAVPRFNEVFGRVAALRPSGFLALGLLVLIATPILRVAGSILAFLYERDWRFAGITFLVL
ncbi:MAG: DUF1634 domain-containing protein, partial [Chloroflexota bacterium]